MKSLLFAINCKHFVTVALAVQIKLHYANGEGNCLVITSINVHVLGQKSALSVTLVVFCMLSKLTDYSYNHILLLLLNKTCFSYTKGEKNQYTDTCS